jgi:hypothetical protein
MAKLSRRLGGVALVASLVMGIAVAWPQFHATFVAPYPLPTYEPIPNDLTGFPTPAQKARLMQIMNEMRTTMAKHHVSPTLANQILWQFHYFVPVRYFSERCTLFDLPEMPWTRRHDLNAMADAMTEWYAKDQDPIPRATAPDSDINYFDSAETKANNKYALSTYDVVDAALNVRILRDKNTIEHAPPALLYKVVEEPLSTEFIPRRLICGFITTSRYEQLKASSDSVIVTPVDKAY